MTEIMNKHSLSALYRRLCAARPQAQVDATASTDANLAALLATAPAGADVAGLLRALEPASARLASDVNQLQRAHPARGRGGHRAAAAGARRHAVRRRWAGGIAAGFALALGLALSVPMGHAPVSWQGVNAGVASVPQADGGLAARDVIFAASIDGTGKTAPTHPQERGDHLFSASFALGG
ncbi:hypothetical protein [Dokdonella sp.]|uniref:hypothetical protein n=1 Tax=Dokdonella sp. TaxID=2291710 RepID=UPI0031C0F8EA|nr:hypothetical protein [Dokdonella sp.]